MVTKMDNLHEDHVYAFSKNWGWFLVWGIALVILGGIAISSSYSATMFSMVFVGFLLLCSGIIIIIDSFSFWWHKWSGFFLHLFLGLLYLMAGIFLIESPQIASVSITLIIGIFYLIVGVSRLLYSISFRMPGWGWGFFNGLLALIIGILILTSWPVSGLFIIGLFIGIDLIFYGITYIMAALAARSIK